MQLISKQLFAKKVKEDLLLSLAMEKLNIFGILS